MNAAPLLLLAVGNRSRGDDALGPALLDRLLDDAAVHDGRVELLEDFQLQIEHALDLDGRHAVLFIDAAYSHAVCGVTLAPVHADQQLWPASHALRPQAVLRVAQDLRGRAPAAWLLSMPGERFALGEGLSGAAERSLAKAIGLTQCWIAERWLELAEERGHA